MKRRRFLRAMGGAAAAAGAGSMVGCSSENRSPNPATTGSSDPGEFQRWSWVHGNGDRDSDEWRAQFGRLAAAGFSGVLVGGGPTQILAEAAHENGLEFHRWVWTLNRNGDAWARENHPEWFAVSRNGESSLEKPPYVGYYRWLCPTKAEVRDYLRDSILKTARDPAVDGIHLDYVRHCDVILPRGLWAKYDLIQDREYPEFDFCYCDTCRETFAVLSGNDPLDLPDPTVDEAWRRFRWDSVTGLVKVLAEAVHGVSSESDPNAGGGSPTLPPSLLRPDSPGKPISAAVFPTPAIARNLVRQSWDEWPLDAFFPILYHEFYEAGLDWIGHGVEEGLEALQAQGTEDSPGTEPSGGGTGSPPLYAGLYLPSLKSEEERAEAVEMARRAGARGVSFFEMNGLKLR